MQSGTEDRAKLAGELCEKGLWREMLALAHKWRAENAADHRAYYYLGLGLTGLRKFSQAEAAYRHALTINPGDFEVWNRLAELLYRNLRRQGDSIQCLEQALKMNPEHKLGWLNLATLNGRLGRHDQALECADRAIALDRKFVEAQLSRAAAARALGKMDIVQQVCHELATFEPEAFRRAS
jgi:tetratricopeptide (TPR) repeat protein